MNIISFQYDVSELNVIQQLDFFWTFLAIFELFLLIGLATFFVALCKNCCKRGREMEGDQKELVEIKKIKIEF